jgi:Uma2 family endonuclease
MTAMQTAELMTGEEFLALPPEPGSRWRSLVEGELVMDAPRWPHNVLQTDLLLALEIWARAAPDRGRAGLPLDVQLDEYNVFEPDIVWYAAGRVPRLEDDRPYPLPDLAVEIRSPSTWAYDIGPKKAAYERHGLPELWLVDTVAAEVLVFRRSAPGAAAFDVALELGPTAVLASPLLPGFSLGLDELFAAGGSG